MRRRGEQGRRLSFARRQWGLSPEELAVKAGIDGTYVRRVEAGSWALDFPAAQALGRALCVNAEWLTGEDDEMLSLYHMTSDQQVEVQSGPGTEGLPGFVVVEGGVWLEDEAGEWSVK